MRPRVSTVVLVLGVIVGSAAAQAARKELRGVWIPNTDTRFFDSREEIEAAMRALADGGINAVFPVVWSKGYTLYPSATLEAATGTAIDPRYAGRDPLAEVVFEAHRHGIEVIPWFEYGFCAGHERFPGELLEAHPDWAAIGQDGEPVVKNGFLWMNSLHPDVQSFVRGLVLEVCREYDVDGVQGDDRLPALPSEAGYDEATAAAWREHGRAAPPADCHDPKWMKWRADRLTDFLATLRDDVKAVDDDLVFSMAPGGPSWAYREYLQDQETWVARGLVDALHPQVYTRESAAYGRMLAGVLDLEWIAKRRDLLTPGVLVRIGAWYADAALLTEAIAQNRRAKLPGEVFFFHQGLLDRDGELLRALRDGPYAEPARLPWRRNASWRPAAIEAERKASPEGETRWVATPATDGPHDVYAWIAPDADLPGALAERIGTARGWAVIADDVLLQRRRRTVVLDATGVEGPVLVMPDRRAAR